MKRTIVPALVTALLIAGCAKEEAAPSKTIQEIQAEKGIPVTTEAVSQGLIRHVESSNGILEGIQQTVLANGAGGTVRSINVKVGQKIRKGATVARMEFDEGSPVVVAQSNYDYAKNLYERVKKLHTEGAVSKEQVEGAKVQYENAKRSLGQARVAEYITSPFNGTVLEIFETKGSKVSSKTPLVKVADLNRIKVQMQINESAINSFKVGQAAFIEMDNDTLWGKVDRTALSANGMTHSFRVTASFDNPDDLLKSGMFKNIYVVVDQKENALKVPFEVVSFEGDRTYIFVAEGSEAVKREVELGIRNGTEFEIISGVEPGEEVIITGLSRISNGSKINVVNQ